MTTTYVNWDSSEVMRHTNERFDQLLSTLVRDDIITEEQSENASCYRLIVAEKNIFGKLWSNIFKDTKNGSWIMSIQKILNK